MEKCVRYSGVNSTLEAENGLNFEVQFRTIESYGLKSATHKEYEEYRDSATSDDRE